MILNGFGVSMLQLRGPGSEGSPVAAPAQETNILMYWK